MRDLGLWALLHLFSDHSLFSLHMLFSLSYCFGGAVAVLDYGGAVLRHTFSRNVMLRAEHLPVAWSCDKDVLLC